MWMKTCFHSHFYANIHASVTAIFVQIFMKFSPKCRTKKLGIPFWEVFTHFWIGEGPLFGPKSGLCVCTSSSAYLVHMKQNQVTRPRSAVGSKSDCRSRGCEFDPGLVPYLSGDWSWNNFYGHFSPSSDSRRIFVSYKRKYVHEVLVNRLVKLATEKNELSRHDHSCWLRRKTSNQTKQKSDYLRLRAILMDDIKWN